MAAEKFAAGEPHVGLGGEDWASRGARDRQVELRSGSGVGSERSRAPFDQIPSRNRPSRFLEEPDDGGDSELRALGRSAH
jgi:hypothetical protein